MAIYDWLSIYLAILSHIPVPETVILDTVISCQLMLYEGFFFIIKSAKSVHSLCGFFLDVNDAEQHLTSLL